MKQTCIATTIALFSALSTAHGADTSSQARELHEKMLVLDTHLDTPLHLAREGWNITERHTFAEDGSQVDLPRMIDGGLDGGFWVIFTPQGARTSDAHQLARDAALTNLVRIRTMIAQHPEHFELALTAADAQRIAARGKRVSYLSIENGYPIGNDASLLTTFYRLGVRMFGPVHTRNNDLADSSTDPKPEWNGLSPLGKKLIAEANRLGMVLDASHASDTVLDQMLELSKTPIILSHSGCKAVFDHPRNVDDERLRKLAAKGGVIQMNSLGGYLKSLRPNPAREAALAALNAKYGSSPLLTPAQVEEQRRARVAIDKEHPQERADFEDFMRHLLHALKLVGPNHVGIGADWDGGGGVTGFEDISALPKITERLLAEGYSPQDIEKIWSGNVLRLLKSAEEYATNAR